MRIPIDTGVIDLDAARVVRGDRSIGLTPIEERLLRHLAQAGRLCSREELLTEVWDYRPGVKSRTIDNTVHRLREKIEADATHPTHLQTVYGRGVRLVWTEIEPPLIGRADPTRDLLADLADGVRLLTLTGPPGVGKSSLARVVARLAAPPALTVLLEGLESGQVSRHLAATLEVPAADPERLTDVLAARTSVLVLLDGCDGHAGVLGPLVADWLERAPEVTIVMTARGPLGLPDETVFAVEPLTDTDAEALYRRCTTRTGTDDGPAIRSLVRLLDGLPLAIELAARRSALLTPAQLCERIERGQRLPDLLGGLTATLATCLEDLAPDDLEALCALAAFSGAFTLEDAEALLEGPVALGALQRLIEQGLVRVTPGDPRSAGSSASNHMGGQIR